MVGPDTISVVITDGGADWVACEHMIRAKWSWIFFFYCLTHGTSKIIKAICQIPEVSNKYMRIHYYYRIFFYNLLITVQVAEMIEAITEAQHWFNTNKTRPLVAIACEQHYGCTKAFKFPAETRFGGKLLQCKRFYDMKSALQTVVQSADYLRFDFEDDAIAPIISDNAMWDHIGMVVEAMGPLLLLMRLGDSNAPTMSKVRGTVDLVGSQMVDTGNDTVTDKISACFHAMVPELTSDIANAAYVLDPQFIAKSKNADQSVMRSFWLVARESLHIRDDDAWARARPQMVNQLAAFRMKTGGFGFETYDTENACAFWVTAGCHAPMLKQLALRLCSLPSSSSDAERNWFELKQNFTKARNRVDKVKLEKMIFVRRFLRLKRAMVFDENDFGFKAWVSEMLKKVAADGANEPNNQLGPHSDDDDPNEQVIFQDRIEDGEQGKINGKEPGQSVVPLTRLRKDNAAKSWLFEKYIHMHFVDKNPEGLAGDDPLEDESEWEYRVIVNVVWWRSHGHAVLTKLVNVTTDDQVIEKYLINDSLHTMIRDSTHNVKRMASEINAAATATTDPDPAGATSTTPAGADADSAVVEDV